jgi:hypothetical protein
MRASSRGSKRSPQTVLIVDRCSNSNIAMGTGNETHESSQGLGPSLRLWNLRANTAGTFALGGHLGYTVMSRGRRSNLRTAGGGFAGAQLRGKGL